MTSFLCAVFAVLSVWEYPERYPEHDRLSREFISAMHDKDAVTMEEMCRKGVKLLPDDPVWHYNLACSLAYFQNRKKESLDTLEKAIDLGYRDADAIAADSDLKVFANDLRYQELIEYARQMKSKPILFGPLATVSATGLFGRSITLGEQNLGWDFEFGCFQAYMKLAVATNGPYVGELYFNRDGEHSTIDMNRFPGLTKVGFDRNGRERKLDTLAPNTLFPYPVFGNCSMAVTQGPFWRSVPRMMLTKDTLQLKSFVKFYLSNQIWAFPVNADTAPIGTNGDVFASISPYWMQTAGRSWSDLPYLNAALEASAAFKPETKINLIRAGTLAPTIMTFIRKSLKEVKSEDDYLTPRAHPTALPADGLDMVRLKALASTLRPDAIPPLAVVAVAAEKPKVKSAWPELSYSSPFAWAYVLRSPDEKRTFTMHARGADQYAFCQTHGDMSGARIERVSDNEVKVTIDRRTISVTNRIDIMVCGRHRGGGWGAPCYVSFAVVDPKAPYSDPLLTPLEQPSAK